MALHRYWRLTFNAWNGSSTPSAAEVQFRDTHGGPHVPGTVTVPSNWDASSNPVSNLFDGNPATWWACYSGANSWIKIDYGAGTEKDIVELSWTARTDAAFQSPGKWVLAWSDDDLVWTDVVSSGDSVIPWAAGQTRVWDLRVGGNAAVGSLAVEQHSAQAPPAEVAGIALEVHASLVPAITAAQVGGIALEVHAPAASAVTDAQVGGIALEVHASILVATSAQVGSAMVEVHTTINERPNDTLPIPPEGRVVERLEWLTDVITNYNGTEQRISARAYPRRSFAYDLSLLNDSERKALYDVLYNSAAWDFNAPAYPYQAPAKAPSPAGSSVVYCNVSRTDLREYDQFLVRHRSGEQHVYTVQSWEPDRVIIGRKLITAIARGDIIMPVYLSRIRGNPALGMASIAGSSQITADIHRPRLQEAWPGEPVTLPTFDGWPLLARRARGETEMPESFEAGVEVIDNATGLPRYYTAWLQKFVGGGRSYLVNTMFDRGELQFWRAFLDYCRGRQRAFLTPTYRSDLALAPGTTLNAGDITVQGDAYARFYRRSETYRRLEIETDRGTFRVKVASATYAGGATVVTFVDPITDDIAGATVLRVSYLMLVRLGADAVTITHENGFATIDTSLRAAVE